MSPSPARHPPGARPASWLAARAGASGPFPSPPGETPKTITIDVKGDSTREANEYFYPDLFGNSGNSLFTKSRGPGTTLNDD